MSGYILISVNENKILASKHINLHIFQEILSRALRRADTLAVRELVAKKIGWKDCKPGFNIFKPF
jgi:hypothetical protein